MNHNRHLQSNCCSQTAEPGSLPYQRNLVFSDTPIINHNHILKSSKVVSDYFNIGQEWGYATCSESWEIRRYADEIIKSYPPILRFLEEVVLSGYELSEKMIKESKEAELTESMKLNLENGNVHWEADLYNSILWAIDHLQAAASQQYRIKKEMENS